MVTNLQSECFEKLSTKLVLWWGTIFELLKGGFGFLLTMYHFIIWLDPNWIFRRLFSRRLNIPLPWKLSLIFEDVDFFKETFCSLFKPNVNSDWVIRKYTDQKLTIHKKSTIFVLLSWNLVKLIIPWIGNFAKISAKLGQNCGFLNNSKFFG